MFLQDQLALCQVEHSILPYLMQQPDQAAGKDWWLAEFAYAGVEQATVGHISCSLNGTSESSLFNKDLEQFAASSTVCVR